MKPGGKSCGRMEPGASLVIINYNGRAFLDELLESVGRQTLSPLETIVVDNSSSDGSPQYLVNNFPWVRVLAQQSNLGFSRAGNLGAAAARGELVAFLNTDIRLEPEWLAELVGGVRSASDIAAVASKLRLHGRPDTLNGVGGCMNYLGYAWDRGMFERDAGQYDRPEEVLFASAGAALFRRDVFLEAGGFDERFFMYHEDVDVCWRLWLFGLRVVTTPRAVAYHHFSGSTRQNQSMVWRELIGERNNIRSLIKNYQLSNLRRALVGLCLLRLPRERKRGQMANLLWNIRRLPDTLRHRRVVQKRRRRSDAELKRLIYQEKSVPVSL